MSDRHAIEAADELAGRMYVDPDLRGDALTVGLAIVRIIREGERTLVLRRIAEMLGWQFPDGSPDWRRVRYVLADDRPRYVPRHAPNDAYCMSPMIRREGTCDQRATGGSHTRDPNTGDLDYLPTCSRHRDWGQREQRKAVVAWQQNGAPQPGANTGGVLARYIALDWPTVYRWGDVAWMPPKSEPVRSVPSRPHLEVIDGDGLGGEAEHPGLVLA